MRAQVIVLAGPSGAGKSRLAERLGLPVLRLDDFYKDGSDPSLPRITEGPNAGLVDWDHPDSWHPDDAMKAITALCETGTADVPVYDIAHDGRTGWQSLTLGDAQFFVAEGIFAQDIVAGCRDAGLLAVAYCVTHSPTVTFWRRLTRDLRERRKPPFVLVKRGLALMRAQPQVVADAVAKGCTAVYPKHGYVAIGRLTGPRTRP
ncbi:uridine kinase [Nocardioides sp. NPDC101246]|uniref:uridine kinase family protein n=1 Tax=Nocardioides sp. NPDC101246 TaxID=3364336 RepID=UPI0037F98A81